MPFESGRTCEGNVGKGIFHFRDLKIPMLHFKGWQERMTTCGVKTMAILNYFPAK